MCIRLWSVSALLGFVTLSAVISTAQAATTGQKASLLDESQEAVIVEHYATHARWELDGTGTRETTAVIRVQADSGVQQLAVLTFAYTSANESVDIDYVRVRKPDGTLVVTPSYNIQDMPSDVTRIAPLYSDIREKHVTVKALGKGDVLEYSIRYHVVKAEIPGQFWFAYSFQKNVIVKAEELELSVPRSKYVNISTPESEPKVYDEGDRRVYNWHVENLKRQDASDTRNSKRDAPPPSVQLTTFHTWDEVGRWYRGVQSAQVVVTPAVRSKADELTKGLASDDQKIRSLYNFVATRFHYVSLSFGMGRYEPHPADEVLDNEYGDCKDKHTLLAALLKASGYDAWPVLINSTRKVTPDLPSPGQFDHLITVVPRGNSLLWLDTTPEIAPFGLLTANLRDKQALVMPTDKPPALMTTPADPPFPSMQSFVIEGKLENDGTFKGHVERSARGDVEVLFRFGFRATSPAQWKDLVQRLSYSWGFAGEISAVKASAPEDTEQPFQFSYDYTRKNYGDWPNRRITPPLPLFGIEADDDSSKPSEPLLLGAPGDILYRARIEIPAGYTFTPPDKIDLVTDYAEYHAEYGSEKGVLTAIRRLVIRKADVPLSEWEGYRKLRKAVAEDEGFWIALNAVGANDKPVAAGLESDDADALNNSGRRAIDAFKYSLAAELFAKAVKIDPNNKWAWNNLGLAYMGLMRYDDAVSAFNKQTEISPNDPYAYNNLGRVLRIQGKQEEARKAFEKQIEINPQDRWAHSNLGILLLAQKKYAEAVHELEVSAAISENDVPTQVALGQAYLAIGEKEKGVAALDKAVQTAPTPERFNAVAYILAEDGERLDQARQFAEAAVSSLDVLLRDVHLKDLQLQQLYLVNLLGASWDTLGWVYYKQGNLEQAQKYLSAAWNLDQHAAVADHLGQLIEKKGDKRLAAQFYAQAIAALNPPTGTRSRLVSMVGSEQEAEALILKERDEISRQRTTVVGLPKTPTNRASAEFFLLFVPGGSVAEVTFISGDKQLSSAIAALSAAKYNVVFPDTEVTKIIRRGVLTCPDSGSSCDFVLLLPSYVRSLN